jgi:hypothetical protein
MTPRSALSGASASGSASGPFGSSTIGRALERSRSRAASSSSTTPASASIVARHDREGLLLAELALAQRRDRRGVAGVAGEVVAAQALDRDDPTAAQGVDGGAHGVAVPRAVDAVPEAALPVPRRRRRERLPGRPPIGPPPPGDGRKRSRGPQRPQAIGWAWKRRSAGSWYSRAQSSHMAKARMVVSGRS